MKVLQVVGYFSPLHGGGVISVVYQLSQGLAKRGHEVSIYTSDFELDEDFINSLPGVKVYPFHCLSNRFRFRITPEMISAARKGLKDFDIIHIHAHRGFQNIVVHHYAQKYRIPYVLDAHGSTPRLGTQFTPILKGLFDTIWGNRIIKDARWLLAETRLGAQEYKDAGADPRKIIVLFPPIDTDQFANLPARGQFRQRFHIQEKHIILYLGRIHRIKGLEFIVDSFAKLSSARPDTILAIAGSDDGFKPALEAQVRRLGLGKKVLFIGYVGGQEKLSALVDATVMVQTSIYEQGAAMSSLEAIMCNTPTVVSKGTGAAEDMDKMGYKYMVEYGNTQEMVAMLERIMDKPSEAETETRKAKEYIMANLSLSQNVREYEKIYVSCIEGNQNK